MVATWARLPAGFETSRADQTKGRKHVLPSHFSVHADAEDLEGWLCKLRVTRAPRRLMRRPDDRPPRAP